MKIKTLLFTLIALSLIACPVSAKNDKASGKHNALPSGLQKNSDQGKPLPPGWDKKISKGDILEDSIFSQGRVIEPIGKDGTISIEVEGKIFKLYKDSKEIIDILSSTER